MKEIIALVWKDNTITHKKGKKVVTQSVDEFIYQSLINQVTIPTGRKKKDN